MATEAPDPRTFQSWEDAFQCPVATVRQMEKQLGGELDSNQEKLRTLVGASYRDLLDTAERIVGMDDAIQKVEFNLGFISEKCNSRLVERRGRNFDRWSLTTKATDRDHLTLVSLLAILQNCPLTISRLLRKGTSILLAAKVLVLSRRIHRVLAQNAQCPPLVEGIHSQLASLWRKLLRHIDRQLANPAIVSGRLVEAMCAFSLARSSSLTDTLKHFHHVRLETISTKFERPHADRSIIVQALQLYSQTLQDTQSILPKPIMEALLRLKSRPLFQDDDLRACVELNLSVHERWIPDDIRQFTPWLGHDDLQRSEAEKLLKGWADTAFSALIDGLRRSLATVQDFRALIQTRRGILETWLEGRAKIAVVTSVEPLEGLRSAINNQLIALIQARASRLHLVSGEIHATLSDWKHGMTDRRGTLWDLPVDTRELSDGALGFRKSLLDRVHGRTEAVSRVVGSYKTWLHLIEEAIEMIGELRDQKWDENLEDEDDNDLLETRQIQLSGGDPDMLATKMDTALKKAFHACHSSYFEAANEIREAPESHHRAAFLLRTIREIRQHLPQNSDIQSFGLSLIPGLQTTIIQATINSPLTVFEASLRKTSTKRVSSRILWEGSPPLPIQPSPTTFKFLHSLCNSMAAQGPDLWSHVAVCLLTKHIKHRITTILTPHLATIPPSRLTTNDPLPNHEQNLEPTFIEEEHILQIFYDISYLHEALSTTDPSSQEDRAEEQVLIQAAVGKGNIGEKSKDRIHTSAKQYWKRTRLLFALLG